ncbi:MAG: Ribonuclease VapC43 [Phycisphaerae bacterium]|nr:Ribonuclease VapC43 [Phycisphaerae bacterium]
MIAVDTNILVFAHRRDSPWHARAAVRVASLAEGGAPWLIPWPCIHEFLAIVTHPRIYRPPSALDAALRQVDFWLESPSLLVEAESPRHWSTLRALADGAKLSGAAFHDARVAAICIDQEVDVLWTADRDFSRFPRLRVENPLLGAL